MIEGLRLIGLTGGIGSGKSAVARMIAGAGVPVMDADQLAREVTAPGQPAHADIKAAWPRIVGATGAIDRKLLAAVVFADPTARARLEVITHHRIWALTIARVAELVRQGHRLAFYEASLLVETGRYRDLDGLVVVTAPEAEQIRRVVERDGCSPADVQARLAAQFPLADKLRVATYVVNNDGDLEATGAQVAAMLVAFGA